VLIIDDDPHVRDILRRNLETAGYQVATAKDGRDGLAKAKEIKPDAITLDVLMPHTDGWTVLSDLKNSPSTSDIPVIMVTISEDKTLGYSLGASEFLSKPVDRAKLVSVLNRFITKDNHQPVLIVEDDAATRGVTRKYLEHEGMSVIEAENGKVGLEVLAKEQPSLILLDLMMPEIDGFGFIEEFRKHPEWHEIPIVVVTAKTLSTAEKKTLEGWVDALYSKLDTSIEDVLKEVSAFLPPAKNSS
jgi:CheY-like chemotaxis protein